MRTFTPKTMRLFSPFRIITPLSRFLSFSTTPKTQPLKSFQFSSFLKSICRIIALLFITARRAGCVAHIFTTMNPQACQVVEPRSMNHYPKKKQTGKDIRPFSPIKAAPCFPFFCLSPFRRHAWAWV